jgi:RHS repeat-associated protein
MRKSAAYVYDAPEYTYDGPSPHVFQDTWYLATNSTAKERDSESGLDNFGARYNSSSMGRFMSPDPMGRVART